MKVKNDRHTIELPMPGAKGVPGRPRKPDALSDADRAKRYRAKRRDGGLAAPKIEAMRQSLQLAQFNVEHVGNVAKDFRKQTIQLRQSLEAKDKEIARLVIERGAAYAEIERLRTVVQQAQNKTWKKLLTEGV